MTSHPTFPPVLARPPKARARLTIALPRAAEQWFVLAFFVRLVAALLIHGYSLSAGYGGFYPLASGHDDVVYFRLASDLFYSREIPYVANIYPFVLSLYFPLVGGPDLLMGKLLNVLSGALSVGLGVMITKELARNLPPQARRRAVRWTGVLLCFYPSALWYSTQLVKDPITVLLGMWALYLQIRFLRRPHWLLVFWWALAFFVLYQFRQYAALTVALSLLLFTFRFRQRWLIPSLVLMAILPAALGWGVFGWNFVAPRLSVQTLTTFRETTYSVGGSAADNKVDYSNPLTFLATYSYSLVTAMFGPFPWQVRSTGQAIALPEAAAMWILIPFWLASLWQLARGGKIGLFDRRQALLLLFSLLLIGAIALFSDNIGANTRLRLLPWNAFLILAALFLSRKRIRI